MLKERLYEIGAIRELTDRMRNILKIFEPIMFPIAIPVFFFNAATTDVNNSGNDVPIAIIVRPIIFSLTPSCVASCTPLSTTNWPPIIRPANPTIISPHIFKFDLCS